MGPGGNDRCHAPDQCPTRATPCLPWTVPADGLLTDLLTSKYCLCYVWLSSYHLLPPKMKTEPRSQTCRQPEPEAGRDYTPTFRKAPEGCAQGGAPSAPAPHPPHAFRGQEDTWGVRSTAAPRPEDIKSAPEGVAPLPTNITISPLAHCLITSIGSLPVTVLEASSKMNFSRLLMNYQVSSISWEG